MNTYLRYCPECGEEYQPHMTHCLDCGAPLKEKLDGEPVTREAPPEEEAPDLTPGDYARVAHGLSAQTAEPLVRPCPACGADIKAGTVECADCGLTLGGSSCESCGAELDPADESCPACGHPVG